MDENFPTKYNLIHCSERGIPLRTRYRKAFSLSISAIEMLFLDEVDVGLISGASSNQSLQNLSIANVLESHFRQDVLMVERKTDMMISALSPIQQDLSKIALEIPSIRNSFSIMEQRVQHLESVASELFPNSGTKTDQVSTITGLSSIISNDLAIPQSFVCDTSPQSANFTDFRTITDLVRRYNPFGKCYLLKLLKREDERKLSMALIQKPRLSPDFCQKIADRPLGTDARQRCPPLSSWGQPKAQGILYSCNCPKQKKMAGYWIGNTNFFMRFVGSSNHCKNCPFRFDSSKVMMIGFRRFYSGRFLAHTIRGMVTFTTGEGGYSISPQLNFRALVPDDSPAFKLLAKENLINIMNGSLPESLIEYFENTLQLLYQLFENKKASPTDINASGETLLSVNARYSC